MTTAVSDLITVIARHLQEDTAFSSKLWNETEIIGYIAGADREFMTYTGVVKNINNVLAAAGTATYSEPTDAIDVDRLAWSGKKMYPQTKFELDNQNTNWKADSGPPRRYHRDQLPPKTFEVWPNPTTSGIGYGTSGNYGVLRHISGALTYNVTGNYGTLRQIRGGRNYYIGSIAYAGFVQGPYGTIRQLVDGATNFIGIYTELPPPVAQVTDFITTPDAFARYIVYQALYKAWAKEGDGQDMERANYCSVRFKRGISIAKRIVYGDIEGPGAMKNG